MGVGCKGLTGARRAAAPGPLETAHGAHGAEAHEAAVGGHRDLGVVAREVPARLEVVDLGEG